MADIEYQMPVYVGFNGLLIREGLAHHSVRIKSALLWVTSKRQHSVQFEGKGEETDEAGCKMYANVFHLVS